MSKIWFIHSSIDSKVSGPFVSQEVRQKLASGEITEGCNIWCKSQREWLSLGVWATNGEEILKNKNEKSENTIWYLDLGGEPVGPLTHKEMIHSLRGNKNLTLVRLWTVGIKNWKSVYEFSEIMDEMGMSRRENTRAPLMATMQIIRHGESESSNLFKVASISVAGVGINDGQSLSQAEEIQVIIKCNAFSSPIRAQANVIYVSANGHAGIKFKQIQPEMQLLILDYIKKFSPEEISEKISA